MPSTDADEPAAGPDSRPPVFLAGPADLARDAIVLAGPEGRHAATVRRLAVGERVDLTDGAGTVAECVVTGAGAATLQLAVRARRTEPPPQPAIVVAQAIPKGDRGQLAVEMLTEAGVDAVLAWQAERCVTRWQGDRGQRSLSRWEATAREAAKQSRRSRIPAVTGPVTSAALASRAAAAALAVVLDPAAGDSLASLPLPATGDILLAVGPEGGISPAETAVLTGAGAVPAHLGPTVLRTSTAGVVAASVLLSRCGRWARAGC
ncbi:MAG: 16S rRNA (uracil(1498)-N(3))-methyltransferase [Gemmatimonadota bacterium]